MIRTSSTFHKIGVRLMYVIHDPTSIFILDSANGTTISLSHEVARNMASRETSSSSMNIVIEVAMKFEHGPAFALCCVPLDGPDQDWRTTAHRLRNISFAAARQAVFPSPSASVLTRCYRARHQASVPPPSSSSSSSLSVRAATLSDGKKANLRFPKLPMRCSCACLCCP